MSNDGMHAVEILVSGNSSSLKMAAFDISYRTA